MKDHPSIQRLVRSLLQRHKSLGSEEDACYQIVVETQDRDRLRGIAGDPLVPEAAEWVEAFISVFQANDYLPQRIQTLPLKRLQREDRRPSSYHQIWKERLSHNLDDFTTTNPTALVVKVLDSVVSMMHHCGDWNETLSIISRIRKSCDVLIIGVRCDALSPRQVQSIEAVASAIVFENVLLRRGVQEFDQWLREDLLLNSNNATRTQIEIGTKPISNTNSGGGKIFLESDDPDSKLFDDNEDPDDDLGI